MKGHDFHNGSGLQDWIEHEMSHLASQDRDDLINTMMGDRNLSLRMPLAMHLMISRIAEKLSRSKSSVSEEILSWAIRDVYKQFELPKLTQVDLEEFAANIEKPISDKPAGSKKVIR